MNNVRNDDGSTASRDKNLAQMSSSMRIPNKNKSYSSPVAKLKKLDTVEIRFRFYLKKQKRHLLNGTS